MNHETGFPPGSVGTARYFRKVRFGAMGLAFRTVLYDVITEPALGDVKLAGALAVDGSEVDAFCDLLAQAKAGNRHAAWELFCPYRDALWRFVYSVLGNQQDAEDTLQQTWERAFKGIRGFKGSTPMALRKWLVTIAANCFKVNLAQRIRARQRTVPIDATFDCISDGSAHHDERLVDLLKLQSLLSALPVPFRQVIELVDAQGFTREEAARMLKRPVGTVNSQLHAARQALKKAWVVVDD